MKGDSDNMICGFNCVGFESHFGKSREAFSDSLESGQQNDDCNLKDFIINDQINADTLQKKLFPIKSFDVFISHSHKDQIVAKNLKSWLKKHLNLTSFLDSDVWGSADAILKQIDNSDFVSHYENEQNSVSYNYKDRNLTTSYVHVMLCNAIMQAMDSCKFVFFLKTTNSIDVKSSVKDRKTNSPWLYYELSVLKYIQKKREFFSLNEQKSQENFIAFPVDLINLPEISYNDLKDLKNVLSLKGANIVDRLRELGKV